VNKALIRTRAARAAGAAAVLAALACAAGCSGGTSSAAQPPTARMERTGPGGTESVVLTPLGAARIAVRTQAATAGTTGVVVPYSALLYEPDGDAAVYVQTGRLTYTRYLTTVQSISGNSVFLTPGSLRPGVLVVTQGAEEMLGVQNGVGEET
jgi:hypothetical protein